MKTNLDLLLEMYSDIEIQTTKFGNELLYYTASVIAGKVEIIQNKKPIYKNNDLVRFMHTRYRTEKQALDAIMLIMPKAESKFKKCFKALGLLKTKMKFGSGFHYEGDTHGIYNEYNFISFDLDGFYFQFKNEE